jgi:uncharacterized tellurite resistance protein B-like protein
MPTRFITKMNRTEAGFHLLLMLSLSDGGSTPSEVHVLMNFLDNAFPGKIDLIKEQAFMKALPAEEIPSHFSEVAAHFYSISTQEDRNKILDFAMQLVMADKTMKPEENSLVNQLYDSWDMA